MKDMMFYDVNCRIGNTMMGPQAGLGDLLADMDNYGVDKALVRHIDIANGPLASNAFIADALKADVAERLTGVWCILPQQCPEIAEPDEFFRLMKANRIGALTLDPFNHRYLANRLTIGKIMDAAAERKIPVLLNAYCGKWEALYAFVEMFQKNRLIYIESYGKWGYDRQIRPLLENYANFYFETAGYWVPEGIGELVRLYGADRILYGSNFPSYNQGNGMLQLKHQQLLSDDEAAKIAGKNLESMLKEAQL